MSDDEVCPTCGARRSMFEQSRDSTNAALRGLMASPTADELRNRIGPVRVPIQAYWAGRKVEPLTKKRRRWWQRLIQSASESPMWCRDPRTTRRKK